LTTIVLAILSLLFALLGCWAFLPRRESSIEAFRRWRAAMRMGERRDTQ